MKKIIISFLLLVGVFFGAMRVSAQEDYTVYDDASKFANLKPMLMGTKANIIKGLTKREDIVNSEAYQAYLTVADLGIEGTVTVTNNYRYGTHVVVFKCVVGYVKGYLNYVKIYAGDKLIYDIEFGTTPALTINTCIEYHPIDEFKKMDNYCFLDDNLDVVFDFNPGHEDEISELSRERLDEVSFSFLMGGMVKYNTVYDGKDVHMAVEADNAMPSEELLKNISIVDDTEGKISDYMILSTNYNPINRKCPIGVYDMRILAKDSKGNAVIQDIIINVVDGKGPTIKVNYISVDYNVTLNETGVLKEITVTDTTPGDVQIKVDLSTYELNKNIIGDYPFNITAIDKYGNTTTKTDYIHVVDKTAPVIIAKDIVVNHPYALMGEDEIKSKLKIKDEIDGTVPNSSIEIVDIDGYKDNYNKLGQYRMKVIAKDTKNNKAEANFMIIIKDDDYPEITIGSTIVLSKGEAVSREQLIELLKQMGELAADIKNVKLTSAYFDEENPSGKYDLLVELPDGKIIEYTIAINEDNDYEAPVKPERKEANLALYVGGCIASAVGIAIAAIFVVVYRKKH